METHVLYFARCALIFLLPSLDVSPSDAAAESNVTVDGGEFTGCRSQGNGAFLYASDDSLVTIKGGTVTNCVAGRRAGMVSGSSSIAVNEEK